MSPWSAGILVRLSVLLLSVFFVGTARAELPSDCFVVFNAIVGNPSDAGEAWLAWDQGLRTDAHARATKAFDTVRAHADSDLAKLNSVHAEFIRDVLLPVLYGRAILGISGDKLVARAWKSVSPNELRLDEAGEVSLRIVFNDETVTAPRIDYEPGRTVLRLPKSGFPKLAAEEHAGHVRRFLQGHTLHPYILGEGSAPERIGLTGRHLELKEPQLHAIAAGTAAYEANRGGRLLIIGSTALGKTRVAMEILAHIAKGSERKLHIVTADEINLVKQLRDSWLRYRAEGNTPPFIIAQFNRESMHPTPTGVVQVADFAALRRLVAESRQPVFLFTGSRQIREAVADDRQLTDMLGSFYFDEAHDIGNAANRAMVERWKNTTDAKFFLLGTTATPSKGIAEVTAQPGIAALFADRVFWAGSDHPTRWGQDTRPVETVLRQMADDARLGRTIDFFHQGRDTIRILNLAQAVTKDQVAESLRSQFENHARGLIFAGEKITDAEQLLAAVNRLNIPGRRFAVLHSGQTRAEQERILVRFRNIGGKDQIHHLIVVEMLGAGFDLPELSLLVDFSHAGNEQEVVQHFGRIMRPAQGKRVVEIVVAHELNEVRVATLLRVYAAMRAASSGGPAQLPPAGAIPLGGGPVPLSQIAFWNVQPRVLEVQGWSLAQIRDRARDLSAFYRGNRRLPVLSETTVNSEEGRLAIDIQVLALHKTYLKKLGDDLDKADQALLARDFVAIQNLARLQLESRTVDLMTSMKLLMALYYEKRALLDTELARGVMPAGTRPAILFAGQYEHRAVVNDLARQIEEKRKELHALLRLYGHPNGVFPAGPPEVTREVWKEFLRSDPSWATNGLQEIWAGRAFAQTMGQFKGHVKEAWGVDLKGEESR